MSVTNGKSAREILEARAREYARPIDTRDEETRIEIVVFELAGESCAVETRFVREVARLGDLTLVPGTPDFIAGVTSLRGEIVCIVDLRGAIGRPDTARAAGAWMLVLGIDRIELGLLVDAVREITGLLPASLLKPPDSLRSAAGAYVSGVTKDALVLLDGQALLQDTRLYVDHAEET